MTDLEPGNVIARVREGWQRGDGLCAWLATNMGLTQLSAEEVYGRR